MKKLKDISVRELLSIEDGFYKLQSPITYKCVGESKEFCSATCQLEYFEMNSVQYISFSTQAVDSCPTIGNNYHVKFEFSSGCIVQNEIECEEFFGDPGFIFSGGMFDNLYVDQARPAGMKFNKTSHESIGFSGVISLTTTEEENRAKYGESVVVTITEEDIVTGEVSGVISISTDTKILDGVTKVITALADDTSYYVDNIWQDGDTLEVSAMDEASGGGEDKRNIIDLPYTIDTANNTITLDDWSHVGSLIVEGNGLTITINEEFASMVSGTKTGDVYVVANTLYYYEDSVLTDVYAYLAPLPYFSPLYTDNRRGELHFTISGLRFSKD